MSQIVLKKQTSPSTPATNRTGLYVNFDGNVQYIQDDGDTYELLLSPIETTSQVVVTANSGTTYNIDLSTARYFNITLNNNVTFSFTNPSGSGVTQSFTVKLTQDYVGSRTVTWPGSVVWPDGTAPTLTTTGYKTDIYSFVSYDGGTTWYGFAPSKNFNLIPTPGGALTVDAADFDGTDITRRAGGLTGVADGKSGIFSGWIRIEGEPNDAMRVFSGATTLAGTSTHFLVERGGFGGSAKTLTVGCRNSSTISVLELGTTATFTTSTEWIHILASWDLVLGATHLYINDVADKNVFVLTNDTIDYTQADWAVGGAASNTFRFNGAIAELYFMPNYYLDFSIENNRRLFRTSTGKPANLGVDGGNPLGVAPLVYFHLDDAEAVANFATNRGTGGNFTITGTLDTASTSPSD